MGMKNVKHEDVRHEDVWRSEDPFRADKNVYPTRNESVMKGSDS